MNKLRRHLPGQCHGQDIKTNSVLAVSVLSSELIIFVLQPDLV